MFDLVRSMFGGAGNSRYGDAESLIADAIERVVDGTDPRLRFLPHYRKRLRDPVIHAMAHASALAAGIPAALSVDARSYGTEPRLAALFPSAEDMLELFDGDALASDLAPGPPPTDGLIRVLLLAERSERQVLGVDLVGEQLLREVNQVAVNFYRQRLRDPGASEQHTRDRVAWRALVHLLGLARMRIAEPLVAQADPQVQRASAGRRFESETLWGVRAVADPNRGAGSRDLAARLEVVADLLGEAEHALWCEHLTLYLDAMNIKRDPRHPWARRLEWPEFVNARGRHVVALLIALRPGACPRRRPVCAWVPRSA